MANVEMELGGIKCDNPECGWADKTMELGEDHIGMPCPKCGQNLLTQEDYDNFKIVMDSVDLVNSCSEEELEELFEKLQAAGLTNEINLDAIKPIDDKSYGVAVETHKEIKFMPIKDAE